MTLLNITRNTVLTLDLKEAKSFTDRLLGLLKKSNPGSLLFKTRFGLHTFCLKTPIDVIVLDNKLQVVKLKESLSPNKLFFWNPRYHLVIELLPGSLNKSHTKVGDKCRIR